MPQYFYDYLLTHKKYIIWYMPSSPTFGCHLKIPFPLPENQKGEEYFIGEFHNDLKGYVSLIYLDPVLEFKKVPFIV